MIICIFAKKDTSYILNKQLDINLIKNHGFSTQPLNIKGAESAVVYFLSLDFIQY